MRFIINDVPMNSSEKTLNDLDAIIQRVEDGVHELEVVDADTLDSTSWYKLSRYDRQRLLEEVAAEAFRSKKKNVGPHSREVEIKSALDATVGKKLAYSPLEVLVENSISDGTLLSAAIKVFGTDVTRELCFGAQASLVPPAFKFDSWGGEGELRKLVDAKVLEAKQKGIAPRVIVVTDSDGEWAGDVKQHAIDIRDLCAQHGVPCPPLTKRTAENYIPDEIWQACAAEPNGAALSPIVDVLMRLSSEQRDHVRLERRNTPAWNKNNIKVAALFENVSVGDYNTLTDAALKGKGEGMRILSLKAHESILTRQMFENRDYNNDLKTIVEHIESAL